MIAVMKTDPKWSKSKECNFLMQALGSLPEGVEVVERDLRGANLQGMDLSEVDLRSTDLRGANLKQADLSRADLRWANLLWADLSGADLRWANLQEANLSETDLRGTNLDQANLLDVRSFSNADFTRATWWKGRMGTGSPLHVYLQKNFPQEESDDNGE